MARIIHWSAPGSLSRHQTEEWKGWMQIMILLYHYFGMSKVLRVYQIVRLLVSSYLFMTAFGHATYFITTNDFSFRRIVASVLLRTNLLNIILAFGLGITVRLVLLSSTDKLLVSHHLGHDSPDCNTRDRCAPLYPPNRHIRGPGHTCPSRLHLGHALLDLYWRPAFRMLPLLDGREFLFRFGLDAYIPYIGMAAAVLSARTQSK